MSALIGGRLFEGVSMYFWHTGTVSIHFGFSNFDFFGFGLILRPSFLISKGNLT